MGAPTDPVLHVVLVNPEIPPNTGNVGRLCLGVGARLHVVHPIAFDMDEKAVRRAGLDYWKHVDLVEHVDADAFWSWARGRRVFLFSTRGDRPYSAVDWQRGHVLVFGCETKGLPDDWVDTHGAVTIPLSGDVRSLNLSNAVAVGVYGALQRVQPELFSG